VSGHGNQVLPADYLAAAPPEAQAGASPRQGGRTDAPKAAGPRPVPGDDPPIPLRGPAAAPGGSGSQRGLGVGSSVVTVVGSLALVVGIFLVVAWTLRRATPQATAALPGEVFEVLGRAPLSGRQQVHLLRCGTRLLLVSVTPAGAETLTEVTDPLEVERLVSLCQRSRPGSATATFRQVFDQLTGRGGERALREMEASNELDADGGGYRGWEGRHV
jgi:flagellar biogenesis protein FliO